MEAFCIQTKFSISYANLHFCILCAGTSTHIVIKTSTLAFWLSFLIQYALYCAYPWSRCKKLLLWFCVHLVLLFVCLIHTLPSCGFAPFPPTAPSAPPQEVHLVSLSSTSLKVSWVAPPAASRHGAIVRYTVRYQALAGEDLERHDVPDIGADATSYVLEGLEKWTEYQVWVMAHTDVGPGPESPPVRIRTREDGRLKPCSKQSAPKL